MKRRKIQKGFISIMLALMLPGMLVAVVLAADTGYLFLQKTRLQQYANAAALSGAKSCLVLGQQQSQAYKDAKPVVSDQVFPETALTCQETEVQTTLEMQYEPILLGFFGLSLDKLTASGRAGVKVFSDGSRQVVLLTGGA